jgi:hypothetical protein
MDATDERDQVLLHASGRATLPEAVLWFSEDHPVLDGASPQCVIEALLDLPGDTPHLEDALRAVVREAAASSLDPSSVLFNVDAIDPPRSVRACLDSLAEHSSSNDLTGLTPSSVAAALREEPETMKVIALIAGLTPNELRRRIGESAPKGSSWTQRQIESALRVVTLIIDGTVESLVPGAEPARPVELVFDEESRSTGWARINAMWSGGVPYEVLLTQRLVGSAWQNHRNSTSSALGTVLTAGLCNRLDQLGTPYLRSRTKGGEHDLTKVSPIGKVVAVMTRPGPGADPWSVIVSVANDTGTANKTAAQLCDLVAGAGHVAVLLAGPGWAERLPETTQLARQVGGHIYTERDLAALAQAISVTSTSYPQGVDQR